MTINIRQNNDSSGGLQGTDGDDGAFIVLNFPYSTNTNTVGAFLTSSSAVFSRRMIVKSIIAVVDSAATNVVTASLFKAASGVALGAGVALHTGTVNLQGAAGTNQVVALATLASTVDVAAGSRIGFVISGALGVAGNGLITVTLAPA